MRTRSIGIASAIILLMGAQTLLLRCAQGAQAVASLPGEVKAVWDLGRAWREATPTRERVCVNGLWRWQPTRDAAGGDGVPAGGWGYFKVPGCWPGVTDYLQKDCQTVYPNPAWQNVKLGEVSAAWYQREIEVPADWAGRRVDLSIAYLNSFAVVYVGGKKVGEARFPAGEVDLTTACAPGSKHVLSLLVVAMPLKGVRLSYADTAAAREVKGSVPRRGLCGDVYLVGRPAGPRVEDVRVETSIRHPARAEPGRAVRRARARYRWRAAGHGVHQRIVQGGRSGRRPFRVLREVEA